MTQHITQEVAVELSIKAGDEFAIHEAAFYTNLCNAAIQHYLDQHKAELPVLPDLDTWSAGICIRTDVCQQRMKAYGLKCAAHARELALRDAIKQVTILYEKDDYPVLTDICNLIATAK